MPYSYEVFEGGGDTEFPVSLTLLDRVPAHDQLRVFHLSGEGVAEQAEDHWWVQSGTLNVVVPIPEGDQLLLLRETRGDRSYVQWTGGSRLLASDLDLYWRQRLHILQEITELYQVAVLLGEGEEFQWPDKQDDGVEMVVDTGETGTVDISQLRDVTEATLDVQVTNTGGAEFSYPFGRSHVSSQTVDGWELDGDTLTLDSAAGGEETPLRVRRSTPLDELRHLITDEAVTVSALLDENNQQIQHLIEESPGIPVMRGLFLGNPQHPRSILYLSYSGPGDTFSFRGTPWVGEGLGKFWVNETPLTEGVDYHLDFDHDQIILAEPLAPGDTLTGGLTSPNFPHHDGSPGHQHEPGRPAAQGAVLIPPDDDVPFESWMFTDSFEYPDGVLSEVSNWLYKGESDPEFYNVANQRAQASGTGQRAAHAVPGGAPTMQESLVAEVEVTRDGLPDGETYEQMAEVGWSSGEIEDEWPHLWVRYHTFFQQPGGRQFHLRIFTGSELMAVVNIPDPGDTFTLRLEWDAGEVEARSVINDQVLDSVSGAFVSRQSDPLVAAWVGGANLSLGVPGNPTAADTVTIRFAEVFSVEAGTVSSPAQGETTIDLSYTEPSGGEPPYTNTVQRLDGETWVDEGEITPGTPFTVDELDPDTEYTFRVVTEDDDDRVAISNVLVAETEPDFEELEAGTLSSSGKTSTTVDLDYTSPSEGVPPYTNMVQRQGDFSIWFDEGEITPGTPFTVEDLNPDTEYSFRVETVDDNEAEVHSNVVVVTTDP